MKIDDSQKWHILHSALHSEKVKKAFQLLRKVGIEPILIKGFALSVYYPENHERMYGDIDLLVSPYDFYKAKSIVKTKEFTGLAVDVHKGARQLDTVSWDNLLQNSQIINIDKVEIRVLRPEDHLRVICVHWLTDGGERKDKLWDVYWVIENRPDNFDWDRCLNIVNKNRRRWIICTIGLAHKYLGLDLSSTPIEDEARQVPVWLVRRVEREWNSQIRLIPLNVAKRNYKIFLQQVFKRFPPNPITATIDCNGDFDAHTRIFYQIRDIFIRLKRRY